MAPGGRIQDRGFRGVALRNPARRHGVEVRLFGREEFRKGRFLHAKAVIVQTRKADRVLYGSANCTVAALGMKGFAGDNEEVCVYRRFPAGTVLDSLELAGLLDPSARTD
jgi:phosphatidylserine/phosphatidylglycerophosphate/cardiolipin synthase-like enzyme